MTNAPHAYRLDIRSIAAMKLWKGFLVGGIAGLFFLTMQGPSEQRPVETELLYYGAMAVLLMLAYVLIDINFWLFRTDLKRVFPEIFNRLMRGVKLAIVLGVFMGAGMTKAARHFLDFDGQKVKDVPLEDFTALAVFAVVTFLIARAWSKKVVNAR